MNETDTTFQRWVFRILTITSLLWPAVFFGHESYASYSLQKLQNEHKQLTNSAQVILNVAANAAQRDVPTKNALIQLGYLKAVDTTTSQAPGEQSVNK